VKSVEQKEVVLIVNNRQKLDAVCGKNQFTFIYVCVNFYIEGCNLISHSKYSKLLSICKSTILYN